MAGSFQTKDRYTLEDLLAIMERLRSPGGCPWDREQTHESIATDFLEETHEALEAIRQRDTEGLKEELGDVLLQVVFHSRIEEEKGGFTFGDVVDGICKKLVIRHPHVFGEVTVDGTGQVLRNWDAIKRQTKGGKTQAELLGGVPRSLPALMRAAKVQNRAKRDRRVQRGAGFGESRRGRGGAGRPAVFRRQRLPFPAYRCRTGADRLDR